MDNSLHDVKSTEKRSPKKKKKAKGAPNVSLGIKKSKKVAKISKEKLKLSVQQLSNENQSPSTQKPLQNLKSLKNVSPKKRKRIRRGKTKKKEDINSNTKQGSSENQLIVPNSSPLKSAKKKSPKNALKKIKEIVTPKRNKLKPDETPGKKVKTPKVKVSEKNSSVTPMKNKSPKNLNLVDYAPKVKSDVKIMINGVPYVEETKKSIDKQAILREKLKKAIEMKPTAKTFRSRLVEQLKTARFRFINEQLYTTTSIDAVRLFQEEPESFKAYHQGYRQQVKKWPMNPLDVIIAQIKRMSKNLIIGDFGCGEGKLALSVDQKVHSFDLVAANEHVIECDMANIPLKKDSLDVAVYCLSLMGTNLTDIILEANRVLKTGGLMKVAEIESRFETVETFVAGMDRLGFKLVHKDFSHNLFHFLDFRKERVIKQKNKLATISLKPCLYKKR